MLVVIGTPGLLLCSVAPVLLMSVAFTGMLTCAGVAVWLWLRHRRLVGGQGAGERVGPGPGGHSTTARAAVLAQERSPVLAQENVPAPARAQPSHGTHGPPRVEPPGDPLGARLLAGPASFEAAAEPLDEAPVERTEFIPSPLALARAGRRPGADPIAPGAATTQDDRTAFVAPLGLEGDEQGPATHRGYQPAAKGEAEDRTCFVAPAFEDPQA
jgi:hypothetical protein